MRAGLTAVLLGLAWALAGPAGCAPMRGPTVMVIQEMHVPYKSMGCPPIARVSLALEFGVEWRERQSDGRWREKEDFRHLRKKVTEELNPLIRERVYEIIGSRDIDGLKGPWNKASVEQLIRDEVNRLLMESGELEEPSVENAILTDYSITE